jgi:hypothetical protein
MAVNNILSRVVLITLLAASFISQPAWGVDCSSSDIGLSTQAAVDNFQATYGGGGVCDSVIGTLSVEGNDISNVNGLTNITSVGGALHILSNAVLTDLAGLMHPDDISLYGYRGAFFSISRDQYALPILTCAQWWVRRKRPAARYHPSRPTADAISLSTSGFSIVAGILYFLPSAIFRMVPLRILPERVFGKRGTI